MVGNNRTEELKAFVFKFHRCLYPVDAVQFINNAVSNAYTENHVSYQTLDNAEKLQASVIIYSVHRHEVWCFGDCLLRINQRDYTNYKALDVLMRDLRAFCVYYLFGRRCDCHLISNRARCRRETNAIYN